MIVGGDPVQYFKAAAELCREEDFFSKRQMVPSSLHSLFQLQKAHGSRYMRIYVR